MYNPYLESINLVIDPNLQALCHNICIVVLAPSQVHGYLASQHKALQLDHNCLYAIVKACNIYETLPEPSITNGV